MTLWISREPPLFIFERLDISCASHIYPSQKLWTFEFVESLRLQFRASRHIVRLNRRLERKVMTFWISRELPWFIFECLDISWASHIHPSQKLWPFEFAESFRVQFQASRYIMHLNRTSEWKLAHWNYSRAYAIHFLAAPYTMGLTHTPETKVIAVWSCRELACSISSVLIKYVLESDIRVKCYDPLNFSRASVDHFWASRYIMALTHTPESKVMAVWIGWELMSSILRVSIYYALESKIRVKSYDLLNFSRASMVHFRGSWKIMGLTHTHEYKVMAVWIFRELSCSISRFSIYYEPELNILVKSYDHLNFSRASVVHFWVSRYIMGLTHTPE